MSKNVKVNDTTYNDVSVVQLPLSDGSGNAQFKDVDEISEPTGTKTITTNGTHDVKDYASAIVNVPTSGGGITPSGTKEITENGEHDVTNYAKVNVNVEAGASGYSIDDLAGGAPSGEITITAPKIVEKAFHSKTGITKVIFENTCTVESSAFNGCIGLKEVEFLADNAQVSGYGFGYCTGIEKVSFKGSVKYLSTTAFGGCTGITDIYVPWSETDEITNVTTTVPWGAENATIHYNS